MVKKYKLFIALQWGCIVFANPSVDKPMTITKTTVIELKEDIIIDKKGTPFIAGPEFGSTKTEKLIIQSKTGKGIRVTKTGTWDLSSFNSPDKVIEFSGNARTVYERGAKFIGNDTTIRFTDQSRFES